MHTKIYFVQFIILRDTTRHTILAAARIEFAHKGADNVTMDDLAKASGVGRRTIYTYFQSREELYHEVIKRENDIIGSMQISFIPISFSTIYCCC